MENKIAVITGGMGQVGRACALRLSSLDFSIKLIVRKNLDDAEDFVSALPGTNHEAFLGSITDTDSLRSVVSKIDHCDLLINAAGTTKNHHPKLFRELSDNVFDEIVTSNLRGPFATIREFFPLLQKRSNSLIVNITSSSGMRAGTSNLAYGASKAGLELITKSLSKVLAPNTRIMAICPGYLETATSGAVKPPEFNNQVSKEIPLGRVGTGDDIAKAVESLYFNLTYMSGSTLLLDGGRLA